MRAWVYRSSLILFFCMMQANLLVFAQSEGVITRVAGNGVDGFSGDGGLAVSAKISHPMGIATDSTGNLYIADTGNNRIRKVTPAGLITTVAGNGIKGFGGDGGPATSAMLNYPESVAVDGEGNLYIADSLNQRIRKVTPDGLISTVAQIYLPTAIAVDTQGNLFIEDFDAWDVYKLTPSGEITTIAPGFWASGLAVDSEGNLYICAGEVYRVAPDGVINTIAGAGGENPLNGGPASSTKLNASGVGIDARGNIYVTDSITSTLYKIDSNGMLSRVAGNGTVGSGGDGGPALSAQLYHPGQISIDPLGNIFIDEFPNDTIRKVQGSSYFPITICFPQIAVGSRWTTRLSLINSGLTPSNGAAVHKRVILFSWLRLDGPSGLKSGSLKKQNESGSSLPGGDPLQPTTGEQNLGTKAMRLFLAALTAILIVPLLVTAQGNLGAYEDRSAVEDVMARYVWAVDSLDPDGYVAVFTEDAIIDSNGSISKGHEEIRKIVTSLIQRCADSKAKGLPTSNLYHVISNVRISFPKPGEALHQSYWQTVHRDADGKMTAAAMGRSEDRLIKRNGKWLIQSRKLTVFTD